MPVRVIDVLFLFWYMQDSQGSPQQKHRLCSYVLAVPSTYLATSMLVLWIHRTSVGLGRNWDTESSSKLKI